MFYIVLTLLMAISMIWANSLPLSVLMVAMAVFLFDHGMSVRAASRGIMGEPGILLHSLAILAGSVACAIELAYRFGFSVPS